MLNNIATATIVNVDKKRHRVTGLMTLETVAKKDRMVMDYKWSKPYFEAWSKEIHNATDGKSYGNLRFMHQLDVSGKLCEPLIYDDAAKKIYCTAEVTNTKHWNQIENGEVCAFSWGGEYGIPTSEALREWAELSDGGRRYIGVPTEVSLVDNPNQSGTYFSIMNAAGNPVFNFVGEDGTVEQRPFKLIAPITPEVTNGNTSFWSIVDVLQSIMGMRFTYTGEAKLQKKYDDALSALMKICIEMMKNAKDEFDVEKISSTIMALNTFEATITNASVTGENVIMDTTTPAVVVPPVVAETVVTPVVVPAVVQNAVAAPANVMTPELMNSISALISAAVTAAMAPISAQITQLSNTPSERGAPVTNAAAATVAGTVAVAVAPVTTNVAAIDPKLDPDGVLNAIRNLGASSK